MTAYRALHFCLPGDDNLGDRLAYEAFPRCFEKIGIQFSIYRVDIRELRQTSTHLDDRVDSFNSEYDIIVIGAGGLLLPFFLESIFERTESWGRLHIPLIFFGVGAIGEFARPSWYVNIAPNSDCHLAAAVRAAAVISVRDLRSWLLVSRLRQDAHANIFMTGCPTAFCVSADGADIPRTHHLALNIPFAHGGCFEYQDVLLQNAELVVQNINNIKWICHSLSEKEHADKINQALGGAFDVEMPTTSGDIAVAYASCELGLVTKAHAGIFCLANRTPFAFLAYDMKCDALMEMMVDFPHRYLLHIDELTKESVPSSLQAVMARLGEDQARIRQSQTLLLDAMRNEFAAFAVAVRRVLEH